MDQIKYGVLHCHTEFSIRDSAQKIKTMIARAKELGAPAIALTDHGVLVGVIDFMKGCKEAGIKGIPGVEAYFYPEGKTVIDRAKNQHLILMPKDYVGYQAICAANKAAYKNRQNDSPCMNYSILQEYFGPSSEGHNHVIATSACMAGVLAAIILANLEIDKKSAKVRAVRDKHQPVDDTFLTRLELETSKENLIQEMMKERDRLTEACKITVTGMKRTLKTLTPETEEYEVLSKEIEAKIAEKEANTLKLAELKRKIAETKKEKTELSKRLKPMKDSAEKWVRENEKLEALYAEALPENKLYSSAVEAAKTLEGIFGVGNFYVELQYHGISEERTAMPILAKLAKECNLPVVAANDAHYTTNSREDVFARTLVSAMRFNNPIEPDYDRVEGYGELYIKTDEELRTALSQILDEVTVQEAIENIGTIVSACNVEFPKDDHYPKFTGGIKGESPSARLRRMAEEGITSRYGEKWCKEYEDRMNYELGIIETMGYSDYICIVQDFLEYGRLLSHVPMEKTKDAPLDIEELKAYIQKNHWENYPGLTIGPGRGSAAGSIVCYLIGITSVEPMQYNLLFERFLNPERVSMPDIDSDLHTELRAKVIKYVKAKYGENAVCNIITKGTNAGKGAIRAVGRVVELPPGMADKAARMIPSTPNAKIADMSDELKQWCEKDAQANELIENAKLIEGVTISYGMHAAGVIISDNDNVGKYVALMENDEGQTVAECDMVQAESDAHLLKMDFLGLKNLDIITDCLRRIYHNTGKSIDIEKVAVEPEVLDNIFSTGRTNSIFQFESGGMKSMLKRFRPSSMEDLILLVAAYRPGPMQYLDNIIAVKQGKGKPVYIAKGLEEILAPTYGYTIYQEQVMMIFNKVAGFSLGEADVVRRAMGKKKLSILLDPKTNYHGRFVEGMMKAGANEEASEKFWNELLDFASYA